MTEPASRLLQGGDVRHERLFLANTPQCASFQHFTDHVFKVCALLNWLVVSVSDFCCVGAQILSVPRC